jgi:ABC-type glycerol-3-phosphate transport system substrate-binding protein
VPKAIPLGMDSIALVYNKDLLQTKGYSTPSDDWGELFEQAKNLTLRTNDTITRPGISFGADDSTEFWFDVFNLLLMQSEVQMTNSTHDAAVFASDTAATEAVTYFKSYRQERVWSESFKKDIALFLDGKLPMLFIPSWRLLDIEYYNETYDLGLDYGIAPVPQLSSLEQDQAGWATYWLQGVSIDSQNYKVAWDFLNFATQEDQLRLLFEHQSESRAFGEMYPRMDMQDELTQNEFLAVYIEEVAMAKNWWMVDGNQVKDTFDDLLNGVTDIEGAEVKVSAILTAEGELQIELTGRFANPNFYQPVTAKENPLDNWFVR